VTSRLSTARAEPRDAAARPVVTVWVLGFTCLVASLGQSLVVPLLPVLPERLGVSAGAVTWLVTITVLAAAVANPLLGRLGDQFGLRRVLLVTVGAYVAGSVICLVPAGFVVLLVGRGLQGAASAAIPLSISLMGAVLPRRERANGIASASAMMGVGGAVGLPLTGILNAWGGLTAVFLVTAVGGLLALVAIRLLVPVPAAGDSGTPVDLVGSLLLVGLLVLLLLPLSRGTAWGWASPATIGTVLAGLVVAVAFARVELRRRHPVVDLRLAATRAALLINIASVLVGMTLFVNFLGSMQMLQAPRETGYGLGMDTLTAGLWMLPGGMLMALASPVAARLMIRVGSRACLLVGVAVLVAGAVPRAVAPYSLTMIVVSSAVASVGTAIAYCALPAMVLDSTPARRSAAANGLNALARSAGTAVASATLGALVGLGTAGMVGFFVVGAAASVLALVLVLSLPRGLGRPGEAAVVPGAAMS